MTQTSENMSSREPITTEQRDHAKKLVAIRQYLVTNPYYAGEDAYWDVIAITRGFDASIQAKDVTQLLADFNHAVLRDLGPEYHGTTEDIYQKHIAGKEEQLRQNYADRFNRTLNPNGGKN